MPPIVTADMSEPTMRAALDCANRRWMLDHPTTAKETEMPYPVFKYARWRRRGQSTISFKPLRRIPVPCDYCPADGVGYCCVCQDTPDALELLTPSHLHDVGVGSGIFGKSLAHTIARVQTEYGLLSEGQLEDLIQGWQEGSQDADAFRRDMVAAPTAFPDGTPFPF